ncbi:MAG: DUF6893 family small protein [Solirubrobacteraceae bacterium]
MKAPQVMLLALLAAVGGLVFLQVPEIRRYLKIRAM